MRTPSLLSADAAAAEKARCRRSRRTTTELKELFVCLRCALEHEGDLGYKERPHPDLVVKQFEARRGEPHSFWPLSTRHSVP